MPPGSTPWRGSSAPARWLRLRLCRLILKGGQSMSVIPPLTAPATPSLGAAPGSGETAEAAGANARLPERQIFDYAIELQQAALNDGGRLANPAALVGEVVEGLRGFFERA